MTETSDDAFLGGALQILQPSRGYRAGLDAVILAAAVTVAQTLNARVLDAGSGVGVVGLSVARRIADARVTLLERDPQLAALARANIDRNDLSQRASVIEADLSRPLAESADLASLAESFDWVLANPPYHTEGRGTSAREPIKAAANAMSDGSLDRWARFLASMARPGGTCLVIHKAEALPDLLGAFANRFGDLLLVPIHPRAGAPANRIVLRGIKGSRAPLQIAPALILHGDDGRFLPEIEAVLRHGAALPLQA